MKTPFRIALGLAFFITAGTTAQAFFYYPTKVVHRLPRDAGLVHEEVAFASEDGTALTGWFFPAQTPVTPSLDLKAGMTPAHPLPAKATIIHFHGNAENMTSHFLFVAWLIEHGYQVFVFDYRGFGTSAGEPTRKGVYEDSVAAIRTVRSRPDVDPERIIIYGQSLGAANAICAVGMNDFYGIRGVIAEGGFASYRGIANDKTRGTFLSPFTNIVIGSGYDPVDAVAGIAPIPLVIIHGESDRVVPVKHARLLDKAAADPKRLWTLPGGGHLFAFTDKQPANRQKLLALLDAFLARPLPPREPPSPEPPKRSSSRIGPRGR